MNELIFEELWNFTKENYRNIQYSDKPIVIQLAELFVEHTNRHFLLKSNSTAKDVFWCIQSAMEH